MSITEVKEDIIIVEDVFNEQEYNYITDKLNKDNFNFRYLKSYSMIKESDIEELKEEENNNKTPCYMFPILGGNDINALSFFVEYSLISFLSKYDNHMFDFKMIGDARYVMLQKQEENFEPEKTLEQQNQNIMHDGKTAVYFPYSSDTNIIFYDTKFHEADGFEKGLEETKIIKKIKGVKNSVVIFDSKYFHAFETKDGNSHECLIFNYFSEKENQEEAKDLIEQQEQNIEYVSV